MAYIAPAIYEAMMIFIASKSQKFDFRAPNKALALFSPTKVSKYTSHA